MTPKNVPGPDGQPIWKEVGVAVRVNFLPLQGMMRGRADLAGPVRGVIRVKPDKMHVLWTWPPAEHHAAWVYRVSARPWQKWVLCPGCGKRTHTLWLVRGNSQPLCRRCARIAERGKDRNARYRHPRAATVWAKWLLRRACRWTKKGVVENE